MAKLELDEKLIKDELQEIFEKRLGRRVEDCTPYEKLDAVVSSMQKLAEGIRQVREEKEKNEDGKTIYYFSMEFLIGKLLENYLVSLGIKDDVERVLSEMGIDAQEIYDAEPDPGLGNGGLGRLAACFLDSMASVGINGVGIGLRYKFGLFRQKIENGVQKEVPDTWLANGYPWEEKQAESIVEVKFNGRVERSYYEGELHFEHKDYKLVNAIPYEIPIFGQNGRRVNRLCLFDAKPANQTIDMDAFNKGEYAQSMAERCRVEALTSILYPDDSTGIGRKLRLRQEYLMTAGGIGLIIRDYKTKYGSGEWEYFPERVAIHINDTHPTLCIPELIRVFIDEEGLDWDTAWEITRNTISFTNHTVLPEASEKWSIPLVKDVMPRVYMIIEEIDRRFKEFLEKKGGFTNEAVSRMAVLWNEEVRMANLSVIGSHSVNGVATIHSEILKNYFFNDFYRLYPERFNNKTNGISHRRFMLQSNPGLAALIDKTIGPDWRDDLTLIKQLLEKKNDEEFLVKLDAVKQENKKRFAEYMLKTSGVSVKTEAVFDIQVKRFHAYKRQLLNALKIMHIYNSIKEGGYADMPSTVFVFSGKAAQGYAFAKEVIRLICAIAKLINEDPDVNGKIQVVFVENFCVSNAQYIYPAADISEQISTAGKEASGTGNMKFMMNGAVTLGTLDGANLEILNEAGEENEFIFGLKTEEIMKLKEYGGYNSQNIINSDPRISKIITQLIDGTISKGAEPFWSIYDELTKYNDEFFVIADFDSYIKTFEKTLETYKDRKKWLGMSLENIANSAYFSSDRTIREYADEIWHISHI